MSSPSRRSRVKKMLKILRLSSSPLPPPPPPPPVSDLASRRFDEKLTEIWEILKQEDVQIIGIVGIGGIGKTALLKEIHRELTSSSCDNFDMVIWVHVSKNPNIDSIQEQILRELGFPIEASRYIGQEERSRDIYSILSTADFLLLLDDVWQPLDFSEIGVPIPLNLQNYKCKVVYTTRSVTTDLCNGLADSNQRTVELNDLSLEEGYELLVENAGGSTPEDRTELAKRIVYRCHGLPLAIITIGRALAGKDYNYWESLLRKLDESVSLESNLFPILKLCYESLDDDDLRSCFTYCCLFQKDHVLNCDQLIDYWIGEGFLKDSRNDQGESILQRLKSSRLLLGEGSHVRMHDVVRDFALCIGDKYLVNAGECLTEAPESAKWKDAKKISLMDNQIKQLPEAPECPNLSTLILSKNPLKKIEDGFFQFMPSLRVLDLSWCMMGEIPKDIVSLVSLQYLNLSHTDLATLPIEFKNLVNLIVLDLSYMNELYAIPRGVLASLRCLQVLNTFHSCPPTNLIVEATDLLVGSKEFVDELHKLKCLDRLGISIKDVQVLAKFQDFKKSRVSIHSLLIMSCEGSTTPHLSSLGLTNQLNTLEIIDCEDLVQIEFDHRMAEGSFFHNLRYIKIEKCWSLKELTWLSLVPNLEELYIERCVNLEVVIVDHKELQRSPPTFLKLKIMCFRTLPVLTCISKIALSFPSLEEITVSYCPELKKFPIDSMNDDDKCLKLIRGQRKWWDDLEWESESIKNAFHPYFKEIKS